MMKQLEIYIDGASKGNPGHAGIGVVICQDSRILKNISSYIGKTTNNVAEYTALIRALEEALILKAESIAINTDSQLIYRQMRKEYKVKHPLILSLYTQVLRLVSAFKDVTINNIPRQNNRGADKLASLAIKQALKSQRN